MTDTKRTETDAQRVTSLASEACEFCRSAVEDLPDDLERSQLRNHQIFDHNIIGKITNIGGYAKMIQLNRGDAQNHWNLVRALAKDCYLYLDRNFAARSEDECGFDIIGALQLIQSSISCDLEIEEDRENLVRELGEDSPEVMEYDESNSELDEIINLLVSSLPKQLQAMFRVRKNLDEIYQLAQRNLCIEPAIGRVGI